MAVESAHLVAGFGRIHWLKAHDILFDAGTCAALAEAARAELVRLSARARAAIPENPP